MFVGGIAVKRHVFSGMKDGSADLWERNRAEPESFILSIDLSIALNQAPSHQGSSARESLLTTLQKGPLSMAQERCPLRYDSGKADCVLLHEKCSLAMTLSHVTSLQIMYPYMSSNTEPDSCKVGARSPRHKRSSAVVPRRHRSSFFWLLTQKTGPQKGKKETSRCLSRDLPQGRQDLEEALLPEQTKASGRSGTGDQAGPSPHLLCYPCMHTEGNPVLTPACGTVSPGLPQQRSSFALSLAQVCKAGLCWSETVKYDEV